MKVRREWRASGKVEGTGKMNRQNRKGEKRRRKYVEEHWIKGEEGCLRHLLSLTLEGEAGFVLLWGTQSVEKQEARGPAHPHRQLVPSDSCCPLPVSHIQWFPPWSKPPGNQSNWPLLTKCTPKDEVILEVKFLCYNIIKNILAIL